MFTVNHSQANSLKPEGIYEVIVDKASEKYTKSNKPYINLILTIRNDVNNPVKGGKLFAALYKKKEPTQADLSVDGYSVAQIQAWCKAANFENGRRFESLKDVCDALQGALVRVQVTHNEYNGNKSEQVGNFPSATNYPECKHQSETPTAQPDTLPVDVGGFAQMPDDDSDVPF